MIQLELYVNGIDEAEKLFCTVFGFSIVQEKQGWRLLRYRNTYDIMLFDPAEAGGESHWSAAEAYGGVGIEIVIVVQEISGKHQLVKSMGYDCSELRDTAWGSTEFVFQLKEGYLLRIKQTAQ